MDAKYGEGTYAKGDVRFKPQDPLIDVQAVVEMAASFGSVAINRAYCNWQFYGRYRDALLQNGVELIQLFSPGVSAKNGADIKLCLDALEETTRFPHIGIVIIVGGDSDFMPVAQKLKAAGRTLIGVGTRRNTNRHWAKSCHEFRYYENLVEVPAEAPPPPAAEAPTAEPQGPAQQEPQVNAAADLVRRAVRLLSEAAGEPWINKAAIGPMVKRLDPTFDLKEQGYGSFSEMIRTLDDVVEVRKGESDHEVRLRPSA